MAKGSFEAFKRVVSGMGPMELKTAQRYLVAFDKKGGKRMNKGRELFDHLVKDPGIEQDAAMKKLAYRNARSFYRLVLRTKERVLESMVLDRNYEAPPDSSSFARSKIWVNKALLQARLLLSRQDSKWVAIELLKKAKREGEAYELYHELMEITQVLRSSEGLDQGASSFYEWDREFQFFARAHTALNRAKYWHDRHFIEDVDQKGKKNEKVGLLTEAITEMQADYEFTRSAILGSYLYTLLTEYYLALREYRLCCDTGKVLIQLIKKNDRVIGKLLGTALSDQGQNQIYLHAFAEARENAREARNHFQESSFNALIAKQVEFEALYYQGKMEEARSLIDDLMDKTDPGSNPIHYSKRSYYKACVLFNEGAFRASLRLLEGTRLLEADREGWNIGIRLLSILNLIELMRLDVADHGIEAFRKYMDRLEAETSLTKREEAIVYLLRQLERNDFDPSTTYRENEGLFTRLASNEPGWQWEVKTPEFIVFHEWFQAKMESRSYTFIFPEFHPVEKPTQNRQSPQGKHPAKKKKFEELIHF